MDDAEAVEQPRVVVLCALSIEYEAVRTHLSDLAPYGDPNLVNWERGRFSGQHGDWDVVIAETGPENGPAGIETGRALTYFRPQVALYVGIAGGLGDAKGVRAGDIIVPRRVYHYGTGKDGEAPGERARGESTDRRLLTAAQRVERAGKWSEDATEGTAADARVRFEPIASGDRLMKSVEAGAYEMLRTHAEDAVAVDMESGGFLYATRQHERVRALVVRGVSDLLVDKKPDDDRTRQPLAAGHAAAYAFAVLDETRPDPQAAGQPAHTVELDLARELADRAGLAHWQRLTEGLFAPTPHIGIEDSERLQELQGWLAAHVPVEPAGPVASALANFTRVLIDLELVLDHNMHVREHQYWLFPWYRSYYGYSDLPNQLDHYKRHVALIHNLAAELTRALNLVRDRARDLERGFLEQEGAAVALSGPDHSLAQAVRYGPIEASSDQPYPGLRGFPEALPERHGGSFGVGHHDDAHTPLELSDWIDKLEAEHGPGS